MVVKVVTGYSAHIATARLYGALRLGRGKINVFLRNNSTKQNTLPKQTAVGEITTENVIPALFAPKPTEDDSNRSEVTTHEGQIKGQQEHLEKK